MIVLFHRYYLFRLNSDKLRGKFGIPQRSARPPERFETTALSISSPSVESRRRRLELTKRAHSRTGKKVTAVIVHEIRTAGGTKKSVREVSPPHERSQLTRTAKAS